LIRRVGGGFEFVHDQMHAYLAARWFAQDGFGVTALEKMIEASTIWMQAPEERRMLWGFAAALLDDERLISLWTRVEDKEDWDTLRRALKAEAERRGLKQQVLLKAEVIANNGSGQN
jgi:tRNA G37 N-methylase Trm5